MDITEAVKGIKAPTPDHSPSLIDLAQDLSRIREALADEINLLGETLGPMLTAPRPTEAAPSRDSDNSQSELYNHVKGETVVLEMLVAELAGIRRRVQL